MRRAKLLAIGLLSAVLLAGCGADLDISISDNNATVNQTTYFTPSEKEAMKDTSDLQLEEVERNGTTYYANKQSKTLSKEEFRENGVGIFTDKYVALAVANGLDFYDVTLTTPFKIVAGNGTFAGDNSMKFDYSSVGGRPQHNSQDIYYATADEALLHGEDITVTGVKDSGKYKAAKTIKYRSDDGIVKSVAVTSNGRTDYSDPTTGEVYLSGTGKYNIEFTLVGGKKSKMTVWIDTNKPKANVSNNGVYSKGKKLTFSDKGTGLKSATLDGKTVKSGKKLTKAGSHRLVLTDKAGNKTTIRFTVKK